jgi:hypothetical protein
MPEHKHPRNFQQVPATGNYMYIIKPTDTTYSEGRVLTSLPTLDMLTYGVEGHIEIVPRFNKLGGRSCIAFCNEEGKMQNKAPNHLAQMLWEQCLGRIITEDHLVGNIVIIVADPSFLRRM